MNVLRHKNVLYSMGTNKRKAINRVKTNLSIRGKDIKKYRFVAQKSKTSNQYHVKWKKIVHDKQKPKKLIRYDRWMEPVWFTQR